MSRYDRNFFCDPELDPYTNLAAAIVYQAIKDAEYLNRCDDTGYRGTPLSMVKKELVRFFESDWADTLLLPAGITGKDIMRRLGWA